MRFLSYFFLLVVIASSNRATATACDGGCWGYFDAGSFNCKGSGGCTGSYERYLCWPGCACGTCTNHGSSGLCCGSIYYEPNFYSGSGNCLGCGDVTKHAQTHSNRLNPNAWRTVELRQDYSPRLVMLTPTESYREPVFGYAYNRCNHTYQLVFEVEKIEKHGGL